MYLPRSFDESDLATLDALMAGDACGVYAINQLGQKTVTNATRSAAECWQK